MNRLKKIQLLVLDVDGVLSDGRIILSNEGDELKNFDVKDGLGLVLLQKFGIKTAIITGKSSAIVDRRFKALGFSDIYQGQKNKIKAFEDLRAKYGLRHENIAYIGDDLPDLPLISVAGFSASPADAISFVKEKTDYSCQHKGGRGAVREVCEMILMAKGLMDKIREDFIHTGEALQ
ncbi:MAG: KdsC family phosphatase [Francisellaceae bacterium]